MGWLFTKGHHYGVADDAKFRQALDMMQEAVPLTDYCYCGDNLITFGKRVGFMNSGPFKQALDSAKPDVKELSIAWRTYTLAWAAERSLKVPGDFVELGVWRGHSVQVLLNLLGDRLDRRYWLYDLFDTNPDQQKQIEDVDGDLYRKVVDRFSAHPNVRVIRGAVPGSFDQGSPDRIAFMHIDMNSAKAEIGALETLWERVSPGGTVILDDYGWASYGEQYKAEKAWFEARGYSILEMPTGQGMVIR